MVERDESGIMPAEVWGQLAIDTYNETNADAIVAEVNNGGDLVETVLRQLGFTGNYIKVHAAHSKYARAEPVAALYNLGMVKHAPGLDKAEAEMVRFRPDPKVSPNRVDAVVWGISELAGLGQSVEQAGAWGF
jgi:phage terminase large subunit-like protein